MELTVVGCAGSFPSPASAASCYLIEAEGHNVLLDLGNGALGPLQRFIDLDDVDAVLLSHLHGDHCLDMCSFHVARTFKPGGPAPKIPVYGPAGTGRRLERAASVPGGSSADGSSPEMSAAFDFVTMVPGTFEVGPLVVTVALVNHPVETFGFRIEHAGRVIAYSADTGPCEELITLAADADVLLCEASFTEDPGLPPDLHLTAAQAAAHAEKARVGSLVLTHLVSWNDPGRTLREASGFSGPVAIARPGMRL